MTFNNLLQGLHAGLKGSVMQRDEPGRLTYRELFTGFFWAGILGFGGVLPIARRIIVDERRWLSQAEFNGLFALCQFMPGANICNFCAAFGARHRGWSGAAVAVTGLLAAPVMIVMVCGALYGRYGGLTPVRHALDGLAAAATGLVAGTALRISGPTFAVRRNILLAAAVFLLVVWAHWPLLGVMAAMLPVTLFIAWVRP
jgi:chromate transporter